VRSSCCTGGLYTLSSSAHSPRRPPELPPNLASPPPPPPPPQPSSCPKKNTQTRKPSTGLRAFSRTETLRLPERRNARTPKQPARPAVSGSGTNWSCTPAATSSCGCHSLGKSSHPASSSCWCTTYCCTTTCRGRCGSRSPCKTSRPASKLAPTGGARRIRSTTWISGLMRCSTSCIPGTATRHQAT